VVVSVEIGSGLGGSVNLEQAGKAGKRKRKKATEAGRMCIWEGRDGFMRGQNVVGLHWK